MLNQTVCEFQKRPDGLSSRRWWFLDCLWHEPSCVTGQLCGRSCCQRLNRFHLLLYVHNFCLDHCFILKEWMRHSGCLIQHDVSVRMSMMFLIFCCSAVFNHVHTHTHTWVCSWWWMRGNLLSRNQDRKPTLSLPGVSAACASTAAILDSKIQQQDLDKPQICSKSWSFCSYITLKSLENCVSRRKSIIY